MKKDNIAPNQFDNGYDETYQIWMKRKQSVSFPDPNSCHNLEDKKVKVVIELREVNWDS